MGVPWALDEIMPAIHIQEPMDKIRACVVIGEVKGCELSDSMSRARPALDHIARHLIVFAVSRRVLSVRA